MKLIVALLVTGGLLAAQSGDWASVKRLAKGEEIRVSMNDGKAYRGQLQSAADDSLILIAAASQETLQRTDIKKIGLKRPSHRGRNTLIGLGIGAGGGLAVGAGFDADEGFLSIGKQVFTPLGAIIGTVIGVAWPTGGWHDVYRK